jgi:hypothetical protein
MANIPCGRHNTTSPQIFANAYYPQVCSKRFPRQFNPVTVVHEDGFPEYRHRGDLRPTPILLRNSDGETVDLDNRWIVPHNLCLSRCSERTKVLLHSIWPRNLSKIRLHQVPWRSDTGWTLLHPQIPCAY